MKEQEIVRELELTLRGCIEDDELGVEMPFNYLNAAQVLYDKGYRNVNEMKVISCQQIIDIHKSCPRRKATDTPLWLIREKYVAQAQLNADKGGS